MPAKQGTWYTVVSGDTIRNISRTAYGRDVSQQVIDANYDVLRNRERSDEGIPFIYPGDKLWIPDYRNRYNNERVTADFDTQVKIKINGIEMPGASASTMNRAMNTIAAGFAFNVPFDPSDRTMVDLLRPFTWYNCQLFIGGELYITAIAAHWEYAASGDEVVATIEARTMPGEMLECMGMRQSQVFARGMTLIKICQAVARPYGIRCFSANGTGGEITGDTEGGDEFGRVEQDVTETDADFLQRLASAKGFLITSMPSGDLLICRANTGDKPAVALIEGERPVKAFGASFDGSKRFSTWKGYVEESGVTAAPVIVRDTTVSRARTFCFKAEDAEEGNLATAVKWRMAKSIAESVRLGVTVYGWRNAEGELWSENMKVTAKAPSKFIFKESEFIIESVSLTKGDGGDEAVLSLVLPGSYTTIVPKPPYPWDGYMEVAR